MPCRTNATTSGVMTGTITIDMSNYFNANRPTLGSAVPGPSKVLAGFSSRFTCSINHVGNFPNQSADALAPVDNPYIINASAINAELKALSGGTQAAVFALQCFDLLSAVPTQELFYLTASSPGYGDPYAWDGSGTYTANYSIGVQGIALWRESAINTGIYRGHMDKDDVSYRDRWRFNRNAVITMQIGNATLAVRGDKTPLEFVDFEVHNSSYVDIIWASSDFFPGDKFGTVTISNVDFTGYVKDAVYNGGSTNPDFPIIASGQSYSIECLDTYLGGGGQVSVRAFEEYSLPYEYTYVPERAFFQEDNSAEFDPQIIDGFTGGVSYAMSNLPVDVKDAQWWWKTAKKTSGTFAPSIEPLWALQNEWYEEYDQQDDNFDVNRAQNDLSCGVRALGATNETYYNAVSFTRTTSKPILPPVERKDPEHPETWVGEGLTITGTQSNVWVMGAGDVGNASLNLQSRYMERLEILPYIDWTGATSKQKNWDWVKTFEPKAEGIGDAAEIANNILYSEDVWCWKSYSFLKMVIDKSVDYDMTFDFVINYRIVEVDDPHYTCGSWRADEYQIYSATYTATYPCRLKVGQDTFVIDLLCPIERTKPYLMLVESISFQNISNETGGNLIITLEELELVQDQGYDHTGRGYNGNWDLTPVTPTVYVEESWHECCDYYSDWTGLNIIADGNLGVCKVIPDEPIRWKSEED